MKKIKEILKTVAGGGSILVFFVMAFEVMIMISPFAFFFYSVFNPVFRFLDHYAATKWLTGFFLPHMVLPPTLFLKTVRVLGSMFFIVGSLAFIVCALQVYLGKIFRWGVADKGLYRFIRHPQYLALGVWGMGMSILWPRFIVLASLSLMFILYFFLAKDEERRMLKAYGQRYRDYMNTRGMFFPMNVGKGFSFLRPLVPQGNLKYPVISALIVLLVLGTGVILRTITLHSLYFKSKDNVTVLSMLPEDNRLDAAALQGIVDSRGKASGLLDKDKSYLAYLMPVDYVMQGMIADTGGYFHLFKRHHTVMMIAEWVLHPFQHLRNSPALHMAKMQGVDPIMARRHHCPLGINDSSLNCQTCPYRRVIIDAVTAGTNSHLSGKALLSFNTVRTPVAYVDINTQTGKILDVKKVGKATAWAGVPTPAI